ncbi:MAG: hypothetical protein IT426_20175 [Pirellulales bacterium]|nr:hypothetical protein [Pirellulales bacterium]
MFDFDRMTVTQRIGYFDSKHGNDCIPIGGWLIFSDGAMRDIDPLGPFMEPPFDRQERLRIQITYQEEMLRRAIDRFEEYKRIVVNEAKNNLTEQVVTPPPPCDERLAVNNLKRFKANVWLMKRRLDELKQELDASKPPVRALREATAFVNKEKNAKFLEAVNKIEV